MTDIRESITNNSLISIFIKDVNNMCFDSECAVILYNINYYIYIEEYIEALKFIEELKQKVKDII